jgi:hypothetical protein
MSAYEKYGLKPLGHDAVFAQLNRQHREAQIRAEIEQESRAKRKEEDWRTVKDVAKGLIGFLAFVGGV